VSDTASETGVEPPAPPVETAVADEKADTEALAPEPEGEVDEKAPSRTVVRGLAALAIVFFLGTVVMGVLAAREHSKLQQTKDARAGVEQVASRFASAVLTYDYRDLNKTKDAVLALSTGKFRTDYEQNFPGLSALFTTTKGQSTATVKDVFVSGIQNDTATAVVVLDERHRCGQRTHDPMRNDRFERCIGRESECGHARESQRGKRERLPWRQRVVHQTRSGRRDPLR